MKVVIFDVLHNIIKKLQKNKYIFILQLDQL